MLEINMGFTHFSPLWCPGRGGEGESFFVFLITLGVHRRPRVDKLPVWSLKTKISIQTCHHVRKGLPTPMIELDHLDLDIKFINGLNFQHVHLNQAHIMGPCCNPTVTSCCCRIA